jgi:hypothetical protein
VLLLDPRTRSVLGMCMCLLVFEREVGGELPVCVFIYCLLLTYSKCNDGVVNEGGGHFYG